MHELESYFHTDFGQNIEELLVITHMFKLITVTGSQLAIGCDKSGSQLDLSAIYDDNSLHAYKIFEILATIYIGHNFGLV